VDLDLLLWAELHVGQVQAPDKVVALAIALGSYLHRIADRNTVHIRSTVDALLKWSPYPKTSWSVSTPKAKTASLGRRGCAALALAITFAPLLSRKRGGSSMPRSIR
jgi:hypothetical protein